MAVEAGEASALETVFLDPVDADLPLDAWLALAEAALDPNPFFGPGFLRAYLGGMGAAQVRLLVVRHKTTGLWLVAAPIGRRAAGLVCPAAMVWTTHYAPLGTPLLHPQADDAALRMFVTAAAGAAQVLVLPYLPLASETAHRLQGLAGVQTVLEGRAARACHAGAEEGEGQFEEAFSGKRRKEIRRLLRRLEDHGPVRFETVRGTDACTQFEAFLDLEAKGWKGQGGTALKSRDGTARFSRQAVQALSEADAVRIDTLSAGDTLVAGLVSFEDGGHVLTWKIAFDEDFARYSPGVQLMMKVFRDNLARPGFRQADSLAIPGHPMIEPLWRGRLELATLVLGTGSAGAVAMGICRADMALERRLKQAVRKVKAWLARKPG